jgi:hypothetical protein
MLPACVTSTQIPSGGVTGLKLEKVEGPQEKGALGEVRERAREVESAGTEASGKVLGESEGSETEPSDRKTAESFLKGERKPPNRTDLAKTHS